MKQKFITALWVLSVALTCAVTSWVIANPYPPPIVALLPTTSSQPFTMQSGGSISLDDNVAVYFGTGTDSSILYDGTDLIIDPDAVGTGTLTVNGTLAFGGQTSMTVQTVNCNPATDDLDIDWDALSTRFIRLNLQTCDQDANTINAPTNPEPGYYAIELLQSTTGTRDVTWNGVFLWAGGTPYNVTQSASAIDFVGFMFDNGVYGNIFISSDLQ